MSIFLIIVLFNCVWLSINPKDTIQMYQFKNGIGGAILIYGFDLIGIIGLLAAII